MPLQSASGRPPAAGGHYPGRTPGRPAKTVKRRSSVATRPPPMTPKGTFSTVRIRSARPSVGPSTILSVFKGSGSQANRIVTLASIVEDDRALFVIHVTDRIGVTGLRGCLDELRLVEDCVTQRATEQVVAMYFDEVNLQFMLAGQNVGMRRAAIGARILPVDLLDDQTGRVENCRRRRRPKSDYRHLGVRFRRSVILLQR